MERFNEVMKRVCRRHEVECIDLAANLKSDLSVFYDDCHFNLNGAQQVAQLLTDYLKNRPPLVEQK